MVKVSLTEPERRLLLAFQNHQVRFLVVGMSSAVLQGTPAVTQDFDLWFESVGSDGFKKAVVQAGAVYIAPSTAGMNPPAIGPAEFSLFDIVTQPQGLRSFAEEFSESMELELDGLKLRVLPLERVLLSKRAANRLKDQSVIPILEATLAAIKTGKRLP